MQKLIASWPMTKQSAFVPESLSVFFTHASCLVSRAFFTLRFRISLCALVPLCLCALSISYAQTPNYTEDIFYNVDGSGNNVNHRTYSDGLGRAIQSQTLDNATGKAVVSGTEYDDVGRPVKSIKSFPYANNTSLSFINNDIEALADMANDYEPAYSSTQYYDDPLGRIKATGAPGYNFTVTAHPTKTWYFGVTGMSYPSTYFDASGFTARGRRSRRETRRCPSRRKAPIHPALE